MLAGSVLLKRKVAPLLNLETSVLIHLLENIVVWQAQLETAPYLTPAQGQDWG